MGYVCRWDTVLWSLTRLVHIVQQYITSDYSDLCKCNAQCICRLHKHLQINCKTTWESDITSSFKANTASILCQGWVIIRNPGNFKRRNYQDIAAWCSPHCHPIHTSPLIFDLSFRNELCLLCSLCPLSLSHKRLSGLLTFLSACTVRLDLGNSWKYICYNFCSSALLVKVCTRTVPLRTSLTQRFQVLSEVKVGLLRQTHIDYRGSNTLIKSNFMLSSSKWIWMLKEDQSNHKFLAEFLQLSTVLLIALSPPYKLRVSSVQMSKRSVFLFLLCGLVQSSETECKRIAQHSSSRSGLQPCTHRDRDSFRVQLRLVRYSRLPLLR